MVVITFDTGNEGNSDPSYTLIWQSGFSFCCTARTDPLGNCLKHVGTFGALTLKAGKIFEDGSTVYGIMNLAEVWELGPERIVQRGLQCPLWCFHGPTALAVPSDNHVVHHCTSDVVIPGYTPCLWLAPVDRICRDDLVADIIQEGTYMTAGFARSLWTVTLGIFHCQYIVLIGKFQFHLQNIYMAQFQDKLIIISTCVVYLMTLSILAGFYITI